MRHKFASVLITATSLLLSSEVAASDKFAGNMPTVIKSTEGTAKTLAFFAAGKAGKNVSKWRRAEIAQLADPAGGAPAAVKPKSNFLQIGLIAGAATAGVAGVASSSGKSASQ